VIPETTIAAFLDKYGYFDKCQVCGEKLWIMFNKKRQPIMIKVDLTEHRHQKEEKPTISEIRRDPGGNHV
jgi:hypothetical protein